MLDITRLKNKLTDAFSEGDEEEDSAAAVERISLKLATAIVEEIKELKILYSAGLTAPNGAVGGQINHTVS